MAIKWNIDLVRKFVEEHGDGDELVSEAYIDANSKLTYKCHICGKKYDAVWKSYHKGHRHQECMRKVGAKNRFHSYEYIRDFFEKNGYTLLSNEYKGVGEYLYAVCKEGHYFKTTFDTLRGGGGCKTCGRVRGNEKTKLGLEYVRNFILNNGDGDVLESLFYDNNRQKLDIRCHFCNELYHTAFSGFQQGYRCKPCANKRSRKEQLEKIISEEYNFAVLYPNILEQWDWERNSESPYSFAPYSSALVWWICPKCCVPYQSRISSRTSINKTGCPRCKFSRGEKRIGAFLESKNIKKEPQYRISDCRDKNPLPFDCACWIDDELRLIEYQGYFHYHWRDEFITEDYVKIVQKHDQIKKNYCMNNNIKLIAIPYWEFKNIESILSEELNLTSSKEGGLLIDSKN